MGTFLLVVVLVGAGIAGFFALLGRLSKSLLDRKAQAFVSSLTSSGATTKATKRGGLYEADDVALELEGREFLVTATYVSRSLVRANLLTRADVLPWAVFSRERALHRFGKSLGINREVQTGDAAFDQQCYVDSPERDEVLTRLLGDAATRAAILELLALGFHVQTSSQGVEAFRLVPVQASLGDPKAADAARRLSTLTGSLPKLGGLELQAPVSVRNLPLAAMVVVFTAGGALGAFQLHSMLGVTLHRAGALSLLIGGGLVLWAAAVALLSIVARGSSHGMQALVVSASVTLLGVPAFGGLLALTLNQRLDGAAAVHAVKVLAKETTRNHQHTLEVESWEAGGASVRVEATCAAFEPLSVGNLVTVKVHEGALGLRWVERLDAAEHWNL